MSEQKQTVAELQAEYDRMEAHGREHFSPKAMAAIQKQLLAEMKKKLGGIDLDVDAFKKAKGEVARKLREAKQQRRAEIIASIAAGELAVEEAADELKAMGWTPEEVARDTRVAHKPISTVGPNAAAAAPEAPIPAAEPKPPVEQQKIVDPITDGRSPAQKQEFRASDGKPGEAGAESPVRGEKPDIEDPFTTQRRKENKPLKRTR